MGKKKKLFSVTLCYILTTLVNIFCQYKLTLRDEKIVYDAIYFFGADLMNDFLKPIMLSFMNS